MALLNFEEMERRRKERNARLSGHSTGNTTGGLLDYNKLEKERRARMAQQKAGEMQAQAKNLQARVSKWLKDSKSYLDGYSARFAGRDGSRYVADAGSYLDAATKTKIALDAERDDILRTLSRQGALYDPEWASSVRSALIDSGELHSSVLADATKDRDYWAQFAPNEQQIAAGYDTAEKVFQAWQKDSKYRTKHEGKNRDEINRSILYAEDEQEADWLRNRATELWTSADEQARADRIEAERQKLYNVGGEDYFTPQELRRMNHLQNTADDARKRMKTLIPADYTPEQAQSGLAQYQQDQAQKRKKAAEKSLGERLLENNATAYTYSDPGGSFVGQAINNAQRVYAEDTTYKEPTEDWTESQLNLFGFYYQQNKAKAEEYAITVNDQIDAEKKKAANAKARQDASSNVGSGILSAVGARGANLMAVPDLLDKLAEYSVRGRVTTKDVLTPYEWGKAADAGIAEGLNSSIGTIDKEIPVFGGKGVGDIYSLGTSVADSWLSAHTGGPIFTAVNSFAGKYTTSFDDAVSRGAEQGQAAVYGILSGLAEAGMEYIGAERLMNIGAAKDLKGFFGSVLKTAIPEGIEEGLTSIADEFADRIVMGDKSNYELSISQYIRDGKSAEEATKLAGSDYLNSLIYDVLAGAVSGGISGGLESGGKAAINNIQQNAQYRATGQEILEIDGSVDALRQLAYEMAGVPEVNMAALTKQAEKVGKKASAKNVGKLFTEVNRTVNEQNSKDLAARLTEIGMDTQRAKQVADAVITLRSAPGSFTSEQASLMSEVQADERVLKAVKEVLDTEGTAAYQRSEQLHSFMTKMAADHAADSPEIATSPAAPRNDNGVQSIKEQMKISQDTLSQMKPVASIMIPKSFSQLDIAGKINWVIEKLRPTGYKVERKGFGTINFGSKQLKGAFKYFAKDSVEESAFEALPYVLQNGVEIGKHGDHKGREYGTVTIAAPVTIDGRRGNMAVVVKQTTDNFYKVHRILTPDGAVFELNANEAEPTPAGESPETGSLATPISSASATSIPNSQAGVNGENVDPVAQLAAEAVDLRNGADEVTSAEGRAILGDTAVDVVGISDAGKGKVTVELADGRRVDATALEYEDSGEAELWRVIGKYAENTESAKALLEEYRLGNVDAYKYARGVEEAFLFGKLNMSPREMQAQGSYVNLLDPAQQNMAYKQGQIAGQRKAQQRQDKVAANRKGIATQAEQARNDRKKGQLHFEGDRESLTDRQKVSLQACEVVAKALGIQVYVFESEKVNGKRVGENGWYDPKDGSIHIDLHAGQNGEGVMVFTLAHELTHFIRDWSPQKFRTLSGFLAEQYAKNGQSVADLVRDQQRRAEEDGRKLSFEEAHEEWVADSMEQMLTDGTVIEKLAMLQAKDKGLVEKIKTFLNDFGKRLKAAYASLNPRSKEAHIVADMVDAAAELQNPFTDALLDAGENFQTAEKNTTGEGGVRYQSRNTRYEGVDLANDVNVYTWEYLTSSKDMQVTLLPEVDAIRDKSGKVDVQSVISSGLDNAKERGEIKEGKVFVKNTYTGRELRIDTASIRHGLSGDAKRVLTNARLGAVIGDIVRNAIPINALHNKAAGVKGTYAMAGYATDSQNREFIAIVTVEERTGGVSGVQVYDVTHAVSGRQKKSSRADTKSQGVYPSTTAKITIADLLHTVKSTHQSILSQDVLRHIGGVKDPSSYYAQQAKYSSRSGDVSDRGMLVDLFEQMVTDSNEHKALQNYKKNMDRMMALEEKIDRLTEEIKRVSFAEGPRNMEYLDNLKWQRKKAVAELNRYDNILLNLEKSGVLRSMIERNRAVATQESYKKAREYYRQKNETRETEIRQYYRESRRQAVERHDKAQVRQQIRKDVERLDSLLNKGTKEKNVKLELQDFAGAALRTAKGTFLKNYNEYDMVRNGVNGTMSRENKAVFARAQALLKELDKIWEERNSEPGPNSIHEKWDPEENLRRDDHEEALKKELAKNMAVLREAGIFRVENELMEDSIADQLMDELMEAYKALKDNESAHVRDVFSIKLYDHMEGVKKFLAGKAIKDMTAIELGKLKDMYRMVLHTITTSNDLFAQKRKADVRVLGEEVIGQLRTPGKEMTAEVLDTLKKMGWANLKPETALELIGSDTLTEMMQGLYHGEDTYARDLEQARQYAEEQGKQYGRNKWDMKKTVTFAGTKITLGQAMSLYAYTKRKQAQKHLEGQGFTHSSNVRIEAALGKLPVKVPYIMNATRTHIVPKGAYTDVAALLTPEQRKYVDAMQEYLSKVMGAKGNEVSMQLYGIKLFEETMYFPLKTASEYREEALGATAGEVKLRNTGFTQNTVDGASNPIVLDDFESVWAGHVDKMSLYHGFVLPMEDFDRVYNYRHAVEEGVTDAEGEVYKKKLVDTNESVKVDIENKMGKAANDYIENFMKQLNGGVRGDATEKLFGKMVRNFKKTAVLGSLSVAVQQPTAFIRAMAYLDVRDVGNPKDFLGKAGKPEAGILKEMYKYAPVALMKKIGGFDPGLGKTAKEYVFAEKEGITGALDKFLGMFPEKMDEWTWSYIWVCTKRQIHRQNPDLKINSEEFLQKTGERFSKIIRDTQVYDSVLTKSQIMRSKNVFLQTATSFMNEPTTSMDMYIRSAIQAKRGKIKKGQVAKTYAAVVFSQILTSAVVSFVYALRDDDEDETYWEKYLSKAINKAWENTMPWYSIPFVKDAFSSFEGYTVERSDMALITDLYQGWQKLQSDKATPWEKTEAFAGSILNVFGIPLKNVSRDIRGIYNTVNTWFSGGVEKTGAGLRYAAKEGLTGKKASKEVQLQNAVAENDVKHILRVMASYSTEDSALTGFRSAVKEAYLQGGVTEEQAAEFLQAYAGDDAADAGEKVTKWRAEKETGIKFDDIKDRFIAGGISEEKAKEMYMTYGGYDEEETGKKLTYWKFLQANPKSKLTQGPAIKYVEFAEPAGISLEIYTRYVEATKGLESDKDKDGKTITDSKRNKVLAEIHKLPLSTRQKDALYYAEEYAESRLHEVPWH